MINTLDHISEGTFTDDFLDFVPETDLVSFLIAIIAFVIVKTIIDKAFQLSWLVLVRLRGKEINFFIFFDLSPFISCQKVIADILTGLET